MCKSVFLHVTMCILLKLPTEVWVSSGARDADNCLPPGKGTGNKTTEPSIHPPTEQILIEDKPR